MNIGSDKNNLPMILIVLDGWGIAPAGPGNALSLADTPVMDALFKKYPNTTLCAHGSCVGLPADQVGNSEAGHMNIGAGRLVEQDAVRISSSIENGTFFKNSAFLGAIRHVRKMNSKIHVMGMLSTGQSPHSDPGHLDAILRLLKMHGIDKAYLHLFTDGRDSPKYSSMKMINDLRKNPDLIPISTVIGRFYAMDRKKKWSRTEKTFNALVFGEGKSAGSAEEAITESYNRGESDEFIEPYIINAGDGVNSRIEDGDSVIFFNLRSDRARQLAKAFIQNDFTKKNPESFKRRKTLKHLYFTAMTDFGPDLDEILVAFPSVDLRDTLPMVLRDLRQEYVAETEKYAHVTYFFNGGYSGVVAGEAQFMIPSPDVKSYDEVPIMSSLGLAEHVIENLQNKKGHKHDFVFLNFAAPDMIGHTGNLAAGIKCASELDHLLGRIVEAYLGVKGTLLITADHGNIEQMINPETGEVFTEHTTNPVPFIVVNDRIKNGLKLRKNGVLGDIAPTILDLIGQKKPKLMSGQSLIIDFADCKKL